MSTLSTGEYFQLAEEVEDNLRRHVLEQWFPRAVDPAGGFHQNYAEDWSRLPGGERSVVYQSRLTWLASQAAARFPAQSATYLSYARHGLRCLTETLWDLRHGGFFWSVSADGAPGRNGEKHVYGISFAIYALAALFASGQDAEALALAKSAFRWLQQYAHDPGNGGWHEALTWQGDPISGPAAASGRDAISTRYGCKSMNTHIHLLESLSALYEVWPDPHLRDSLVEVFELVRDKVAVEAVGCLNLYFTPDWRALPDHDSFGHDVETAFLLVEAAAALGMPDDPRTWALARRIVDHALDFGWDKSNGGFYDAGGVFGHVFDRKKVWWVQAEGLNALLLIDGKFGGETRRYWEAFMAQWQFIKNHQVDHTRGGWYSEVAENGDLIPGRVKSDGWTEGYHQGRALLTVSAALRLLAQESEDGAQESGDGAGAPGVTGGAGVESGVTAPSGIGVGAGAD